MRLGPGGAGKRAHTAIASPWRPAAGSAVRGSSEWLELNEIRTECWKCIGLTAETRQHALQKRRLGCH